MNVSASIVYTWMPSAACPLYTALAIPMTATTLVHAHGIWLHCSLTCQDVTSLLSGRPGAGADLQQWVLSTPTVLLHLSEAPCCLSCGQIPTSSKIDAVPDRGLCMEMTVSGSRHLHGLPGDMRCHPRPHPPPVAWGCMDIETVVPSELWLVALQLPARAETGGLPACQGSSAG